MNGALFPFDSVIHCYVWYYLSLFIFHRFFLFQDDLEEGMKVGTFLNQQFSRKDSTPPLMALTAKQKAVCSPTK